MDRWRTFALAVSLLSLGRAPIAAAQSVTWNQLAPTTAIPQRAAMASAYDPVSAKVVIFGGFGAGGHSAETWTFDGSTWTQLTPSASPPARAGASMAFDSVTQTLVLFGGYDGLHYLGDTWIFDGTTSTWTQAAPTTSPKAVTGPMLFTDPLNGHATAFGGFDGRFYQLTTYQWTGTDWTKLSVATAPSARSAGIVALDPVRQEVVLFGGLGSVNPDNTWLWDGTTWTEQKGVVQPPLRYYSAAAFEPHLGGVLVFGGGSGGARLNDTWLWDGAVWQQLQPATAPVARESFAMAYDAAIDRVVLGGGVDGATFPTDTWEFLDEGEFVSIGPGIGGALGAPTLVGSGDLSIGSTTGFIVTIGNALPSSPAILLASLTQAAVPFKGGFLYPFPVQAIVPLLTDGAGGVTVPASIPVGVTSGTTIFMQAWIPDATAPKRSSGTNGLEAIVP